MPADHLDTLSRQRDALADAFDDLARAREVAERAGIPRHTQPIDQPDMRGWWWETLLIAWRRGVLIALVDQAAADPMAAAYLATLVALRDDAVQLQAQPAPAGVHLAAPAPPAPPVLFGRDALLDAIARDLKAPGPPVALRGLPGAGKTALALALADRADVKTAFPDGRAWLPIGPEPIIFDLLGRLLEQFGVPVEELRSEAARADRLRQALNGKRCLVILDDIWAAQHARPFLDAVRAPARILFTARSASLASDLGVMEREVPLLDEDASLQMLTTASARAAEAIAADLQGGVALVRDLGHLPLALQIAGRQLDRLARSEGPKQAARLLARDIAGRLLALRAVGQHTSTPGVVEPSLDAILAASYDRLSGDAEKMAFRRLGALAPQPADFDATAMAVLWEADEDTALALRLALRDAGLLERSQQSTDDAPRYTLHQVIARFAVARLAEDETESSAAHAAHADHYLSAMQEANEAGHFHTMRADLPQILAALEWAAAAEKADVLLNLLSASADLLHHFGAARERIDAADRAVALAESQSDTAILASALITRANALSDESTAQDKDRARLMQALADYESALRLLAGSPLGYGLALSNRVVLLEMLAHAPGEDLHARHLQALADCDTALPALVDHPQGYSNTLLNRANVLAELADLRGEDRHARMLQALADYDRVAALRHAMPLDYASTLNNRASLNRKLASMTGEDRRARLLQALADHDEALPLRGATPLDYAQTLGNRASVYRDLATVRGEDRRARLLQALADYDAALLLLGKGSLAYANALGNRANVYVDLSSLPVEDHRARLLQALADYDAALPLVTGRPLSYANILNGRGGVHFALAGIPGEDSRARLLLALADRDAALPLQVEAPVDYARSLFNRAGVLSALASEDGEDSHGRLLQAMADYDAALPLLETEPLLRGETLGSRAVLHLGLAKLDGEDQGERLGQALVDAYMSFFLISSRQHPEYRQIAGRVLRRVRDAIVNAYDAQAFTDWWAELAGGQPIPDWLA
jgi:hypothetical protein